VVESEQMDMQSILQLMNPDATNHVLGIPMKFAVAMALQVCTQRIWVMFTRFTDLSVDHIAYRSSRVECDQTSESERFYCKRRFSESMERIGFWTLQWTNESYAN
jgi:hypothetical protein